MNEVDKYIENAPQEVQQILRQIRRVILDNAPGTTEKISWGMPAFSLNGYLCFFAAQKTHVGFYPTASGVAAFIDKLAEFKTSKGGIQFPYNKPVPYDLIAEIVRFRVAENSSGK